VQLSEGIANPLQAVRVPEGSGPQNARQSTCASVTVSPTHTPTLPTPSHPPGNYWHSSLLDGIEPATFRLVAQYLNQLQVYVPPPPPLPQMCNSKFKIKIRQWFIRTKSLTQYNVHRNSCYSIAKKHLLLKTILVLRVMSV